MRIKCIFILCFLLLVMPLSLSVQGEEFDVIVQKGKVLQYVKSTKVLVFSWPADDAVIAKNYYTEIFHVVKDIELEGIDSIIDLKKGDDVIIHYHVQWYHSIRKYVVTKIKYLE